MSSVQLDDLPVEIFDRITQYLSLKECVRLERVNSKWRNAMRKEWRRMEIVDFNLDPLFCGILNDKNNHSACVDTGTVCLQELALAVKILTYVQEIKLPYALDNRDVVAFFKKLSELSTPKLRELTFGRDCENFNESDAKIMADVAQSIPLTLESLRLTFLRDECNAYRYFCDSFLSANFTQLKSMHIEFDGDSSLQRNALQTRNLKELSLLINRCTNENVFDIINLDQLTDLETLRLYYNKYNQVGRAAERSFCITLETITSKDCKFLQTLKKLDLLGGDCTDEQLLSHIGRFSAVQWLQLPEMKEIDRTGRLRILRSIDRGCAHLKSLVFNEKVEDEVLIEVADGFHNLCKLSLNSSSVQQIGSFVNRLSVDRHIQIQCCVSPFVHFIQST